MSFQTGSAFRHQSADWCSAASGKGGLFSYPEAPQTIGFKLAATKGRATLVTMSKLLHLIVACAENRVIGRDGRLPWRIPEDSHRFNLITAGQICIMGRISFETWTQVTRDRRQPIVVTHRPLPYPGKKDLERPRAEAREHGASIPIPARSLSEALAVAETIPGDVFVCGGQEIYEQAFALNRPLRLHLTLVHAEVPGDRFFPEWRQLAWRELERRPSRDEHFQYTFLTLERIG